jgi:hypothetical protein
VLPFFEKHALAPFCARPTTAKELAWSLNKARLGTPAMSDGKNFGETAGTILPL